jgi:membrane-bound ClpP family serine protease
MAPTLPANPCSSGQLEWRWRLAALGWHWRFASVRNKCGQDACATGGTFLVLAALLVAAWAMFPGSPALGKEPRPRQGGCFVRLTLPITGQTFDRTRRIVRRAIDKAKKEDTRLVLVFEFEVPKGQKNFGRGSEFGAAHDLANFLSSEELNAVRTVAYLPQSIEGHAVLAAIACQEIVMAKSASIGAAGVDEPIITPTLRSAYTEIANRRRTVPAILALGMLDPAVQVLDVETEAGSEFVTPEGLAKLKKQHTTKEPVVVKRAGEQGEFNGGEARRWSIARYLAADRRELVKALELPPAAIENDPSLEGGWRAVRVDLKGPLRADSVRQAQNLIEEQIRDRDINFVCLWIDSPGGSVADAMDLANFLAFGLDPSKVRTVAYVPVEARSDAAIVALACDQLVMHPRAVLGGSGAYEPSAEEVQQVRQAIRKELAPRKGRSWSLVAAMIDAHLNVFRASKLGDVEYLCDDELAEQSEPDKWQRGTLFTTPGIPLRLSGTQAEECQLANHLVENFAQFKQYYGLENDPELVEPGWADFLIQALASPGVAVLLLVIGGAALYVELHVPGIGVGGFVAAICFLLFFWSRYLGGTAGWLEVSLFIAGVSCLLLEVFVIPGFGIFGLGGGILVLASLVLASQTFVWPRNEYQFDQLERSLLTILAAGLGLLLFAWFLRKRLPRSRLLGRMMLEPPAGEEAETIRRRESLVDFHELVGTSGTTTTQLTPGGKARFGDMLVDVIADGEVIDRGTAIEVVDVRGSRVLVRKVEREV